MKTSPRGIDFIKQFEGFRSHPYQCQANVWTIGYGHTAGVTADTDPVSESAAVALLQRDIAKYERSVFRLVQAKLTQRQFDALVSFTFNLGGGALQRSKLRMKLNRGDYIGAAAEFLRWTRAGGVVRRGLVRRREAERAMFLKGTRRPSRP
jgi:lysozyme